MNDLAVWVAQTDGGAPFVMALLLAAVCSLNCLFIYAWEHPFPNGQTPHPITAVALRYLPA